MPRATGDTRFAYLSNSDGSIPATPVFQKMHLSKMPPIRMTKETVNQEAIRGDGNRYGTLVSGKDVAGALEGQLIYGALDDWLEGALRSTWSSDVLTNGTTDKHFACETALKPEDGGAYDSYFRHDGVKAGGITLNMSARDPITYSIPVVGLTETTDTGMVAGATYTDAVDDDAMVAGSSIGNVLYSGSTKCMQSLTLTVSNGLVRQECMSNVWAEKLISRPITLTATTRMYFNTIAEYDALAAHSNVTLSFELGSVSGSKYRVSLPGLRGNPEIPADGEESEVMLNVNFTGQFDSATAGTIKIERGVT